MKKCIVSLVISMLILISTITFASSDRVSLGYLYNSSEYHSKIVNDTNGNINVVSPTCFDLANNGHLLINNIFSQEFVNEMHSKNIKVTPFLSNHWGRKKAEAALKNPEILADEIVIALENYSLDGVNIDLENLLARDKDRLTNFVRILKEKMPEEKILSVAVASNPNKLTRTWIAAYDYQALAEYADYLVLMAYDEHSVGGAEGPVASINFVEESIKVMLESVSRDKIVLGIPLYGRFWKEGSESGGEAIVMSQIDVIAKRYNKVPRYNNKTGTATLTINVLPNERKAYVNGRYLDEGEYNIYFENRSSILAKLDLMNEYGLKGSALWAIGNESDGFWKYYESGFANNDYESEESIKERALYEYVQKLIQQVEPLELEPELDIENKFEEEMCGEYKGLKKIHMDHVLEKKIVVPTPFNSNEKVVEKGRYFKKIEKISISHMIRKFNTEVK